MNSGKPTPEQVLAAVQAGLHLLRTRLIACRNRLYRATGTFPEEMAVALHHTDFLLDDLIAGLVSPAKEKTPGAGARRPAQSTRIQ